MTTKISQAVAAVLALGATVAAHATDLSTISTSNILFVSGSTAIDNGIIQRFINTTDGLCQAGTIDTYSGTQTGVKFVAVGCQSGANAVGFGIATNTAIAVIKEDNAGSLNGITPVNNNTAIPFPNPTLITTANCGAGPIGHVCNGSVTATNRAPNFGYSDVNAELFGANTNNLNETASVDTLFGIGASLGFYHALQQLQGLTADDNVTHMPSLHHSQIYSILQSLVPPNILVNSTTNAGATKQLFGTNTNANSFCGNSATACATSDANNVYLCLRGQSSGTMQTSQVYFGRIGCAPAVPPLAAPSKPTCAADGCGWVSATFQNDPVFAGAGTGDVLSCLQAHDAIGHLAVGIVGTENFWGNPALQTNAARRDWRFVKIDGVVPSIENVAANKYEYWAQSASYAPKAGSNKATGVAGGLASAAVQIGSPGVVVALNSAFQSNNQPAFDAGFLALPGGPGNNTPNSSTATLAQFRANPVNSYNKGTPDATNNCQNPVLDNLAPDSANDAAWAIP